MLRRHTHSNVYKSIFKSIRRPSLISKIERCVHKPPVRCVLIKRLCAWPLRSRGGRVRGRPPVPWGKRLTISTNHTDNLTHSSPLSLLSHTACTGLHDIIQLPVLLCLYAKPSSKRKGLHESSRVWNEFVFFKIEEMVWFVWKCVPKL